MTLEQSLGTAGRRAREQAVLDVSRPSPSKAPLGRALVSLAGAVGVVLLIPLALLLVGLPVAIAIRGIAALLGLVTGSR